MDTLLTTGRLLLRLMNSNDIEISLRNVHFRYRSSIEYREFAIPETVSLSSFQFQVSHNTEAVSPTYMYFGLWSLRSFLKVRSGRGPN